ncbi:MAG TPA: DUF2304 domain-containing protein [Candidatus Woesearchaeota archaeon]|nr:DUF2304 domain-containing protein [Candidatus Woesearchaeota archaeon]
MIFIQIVALLFGCIMAYFAYFNYKKKEISLEGMIFWCVVWLCFIGIALFPSLLNPIVETLSFTRAFDLLVVLAFGFLATFTFYNYILMSKVRKKLERLVQRIAKERVIEPRNSKSRR